MIKQYISILLFSLFVVAQAGAQQNVELVSQFNPDVKCNDIWAYTDQAGTEYAVLGTFVSTKIISLADPNNPIEIANIPGAMSTWRDMKSFGNFIYVVADQGSDGLLVIDMSQAPNEVTHSFYKPLVEDVNFLIRKDSLVIDTLIMNQDTSFDTTTVVVTIDTLLSNPLSTCHNLYIDEGGFIYLSGCNGGCDSAVSGAIILDANISATTPPIVGIENVTYSHDLFVLDDKMYASQIVCGFGNLGIYDVRDKANPALIAQQPTALRFTHNAWTNDDGSMVFTTDERANAFVEAFDISDLENIKLTDQFRPTATEGLGVIPHNVHYKDGYLYISYYTDGLIIVDAQKPDNLIQVGQYDTWPGEDGGFNGAWGATPFLESGLVLVSDISTGLYVLQPKVQRACYVEGSVIDEQTSDPINGVSIKIISDDPNGVASDATGDYQTGQASSGSYAVQFMHPDYITLDTIIALEHGSVSELNVSLKKLQAAIVGGISLQAIDGSALGNVSIRLQNELTSQEAVTDAQGLLNNFSINEGTYQLIAGKWGYQYALIDELVIKGDTQIEVSLEEGYHDDFALDYNWTVSSEAISGEWTRAVPVGTSLEGKASNVDKDLPDDVGTMCYLTGNAGGTPGEDDVDNGEVTLTSPLAAVSSYADPQLSYHLWFFNDGGMENSPLDDSITVLVTNQIDTVILEVLKTESREPGFWRDASTYMLNNLIEVNDQIQVIFKIGDYGDGHIVEGGIDGFKIIDANISSVADNVSTELNFIFPNPTTDIINFDQALLLQAADWQLEVINITGQIVMQQQRLDTHTVSMKDIPNGSYYIKLRSESLEDVYMTKLVKL